MKHLLLLICLTATSAQGITQYRDFTSADGKTIKAAVKAYDAQKQIVTIERDNRKVAKVPITVFSEADQDYIREWEVLRYFMMDRYFKISAKRKKGKNKEDSYSGSYFEKDVKTVGYDIVLENNSTCNLNKIEVEYCIYYEQEEISNRKQVCNQGMYCGDLSVDNLTPKSEKRLRSNEVTVYTEELASGASYVNDIENVQRGEVHGIWVRVHLKLPSGESRTREYCLPDSLRNSKAWVTSSIRAGMN